MPNELRRRNTIFGDMLRRERLRREERQVEAAERFGVSQSSFARWESGDSAPSPTLYGKLADYMGLELAEIYELIHDTPPPTTLEDVRQTVTELEGQLHELAAQVTEERTAREKLETRVGALQRELSDLRSIIKHR